MLAWTSILAFVAFTGFHAFLTATANGPALRPALLALALGTVASGFGAGLLCGRRRALLLPFLSIPLFLAMPWGTEPAANGVTEEGGALIASVIWAAVLVGPVGVGVWLGKRHLPRRVPKARRSPPAQGTNAGSGSAR